MFWGVINSMWIGNLFLLLLSMPLIGIFVRMLRVRPTILAPITVAIVMLGVYTVNNSIIDLWIVLVFGVVGWLMKKAGFEPGPMVLAFVLGSLLEVSARQSLLLFEGDMTGFVTRPIAGTLLGLMALTVVLLPFLLRLRERRVTIESAADVTDQPAGSDREEAR